MDLKCVVWTNLSQQADRLIDFVLSDRTRCS